MQIELGREALVKGLERISAVVPRKSTTAFQYALLTVDADALWLRGGDAAYLTMAHNLAPAKITTEILGDSMHVIMPMRID